jgi:phosphopantothenoylcysteine decarboxylase/phosphopantothenate--cysteine ligase
MTGARILLIVGGGIAAYKACELIRLIRKAGMTVRCVLTDGGAQFVTPMTLAALSEQPVHTSLWDLKDEAEMGHIQLSREADLVVVAPATADLLARMAATDKPVLAAPAMNVRMWQHAATRRNVERLRGDGVTILEPDEGPMACGEFGPGRLPEPDAIMAAISQHLGAGGALAGKHVIVTAGPTHEPIDPVRYIANRSSGKQGYAIAAALARHGAGVTLVSGPVQLTTPAGVTRVEVETARQMAAAVEAALPADAAVMVAAVADWRVEPSGAKIKKQAAGPPALSLEENPDILATLCRGPRRPRLVIGFAAETDDVLEHAQAKLARKGADWIVANDVSGDVMGGADNTVHLITERSVESWDRSSKTEVAERLVQRMIAILGGETT